MSQTAFPGPTPAYTNPPIEPQNFKPSMFFISAISQGMSTTITTSINHNYIVGQEVRTLIPAPYGIQGLDEQLSYVTSVPAANQVVVNINSTSYNAFNSTPKYSLNRPQIIAVGDILFGNINIGRVTSTLIPGSFQNISPQPPNP